MVFGTSKLEEKEIGNMPIGLMSFRARIDSIMQRRRVRNASIVSTTELLRPEDRDIVEDNSLSKIHVKGDTFRRDDDLPSSPSFRIYFTEARSFGKDSDDDDPDHLVLKIKEAKQFQVATSLKPDQEKEQKESRKSHTRENSKDSLISIEDYSDLKPCKKEKNSRFRGLTKAHSHVYSFLAMRSCYASCSTINACGSNSFRHHNHHKPTH